MLSSGDLSTAITLWSDFLVLLFPSQLTRLLPAFLMKGGSDPELTLSGFLLNIVSSCAEEGKGLTLCVKLNVHLGIGVGISSQLLILAISDLWVFNSWR